VLRAQDAEQAMRELAGRMSCEPSNATVVIDHLESQRLIERRPHPTDRRARQLMLTPEGAGRREKLLESLRDEEPLMAGLTPQERDTLQGPAAASHWLGNRRTAAAAGNLRQPVPGRPAAQHRAAARHPAPLTPAASDRRPGRRR
jgi:DNA-binding MarR family transcriptional regulator